MTPDLQKELLLAKVKSMIEELEERTGSNPYISFDLQSFTVEDLAQVRRDLHEILYAPPPRGSSR